MEATVALCLLLCCAALSSADPLPPNECEGLGEEVFDVVLGGTSFRCQQKHGRFMFDEETETIMSKSGDVVATIDNLPRFVCECKPDTVEYDRLHHLVFGGMQFQCQHELHGVRLMFDEENESIVSVSGDVIKKVNNNGKKRRFIFKCMPKPVPKDAYMENALLWK